MADTNSMAADSAAVEYNLDHAAHAQALDGNLAHAVTEAHGGPSAHEPDPSIAGVLDATVIVSLAMLVFLIILVWKKVPAVITGVLDQRIADIRKHLDEAATLRKEAETLKAEYQEKMAAIVRDADALRARAADDAAQAVEDAKAHAAELIGRRQKMAEDKIAAAERAAIADIRDRTVKAATAAAATLIAQNHGAAADAAMVDQAISKIGATH
ncbi:F0F1 ATP synthase subunit B [Sphingobium sufflavum]|uniref:F0F1 ATP synthase subunit B family protein n=1 Tax=Sphingobium sufflavum TaxID=1129547 RepID=UPI001F1632D9|nr:F0F1 ATP synthase subunit B [Sphingobium sufflavum]MCE7797014.1 F0F1 ATP synthase subunit B [Sphingobium sufflavum]